MVDGNGLTPTQRRLLAVLKDGEPHSLRELFGLLADPEGAALDFKRAKCCLRVHLTALRKVLRPKGQDVIMQLIHRRSNYRIVRPISRVE